VTSSTNPRPAEELDWHARKLLSIILTEHKGRENAAKRNLILQKFRTRFDNSLTDSEMRVCKELLIDAGHPICRCAEGYFHAARIEEGAEEKEYRDRMARDHAVKGNKIMAACMKYFGPQMDLPMAGGRSEDGKT